jgi:hypothetical protein
MKERIAFARFINEHGLQYIGFLDTKTGFLDT